MSVSRPTSTIAASLLAVGLVACAQPPAPLDRVGTTPLPPPPPDCRPLPPGEPLAQWPAGECPLVLVQDAEGVRVESLAMEPTPVRHGQPPLCSIARCRYEGVQTELGPMIVAIEPGPQSEVPRAVHLGFVAGTTLTFVDLWAAAGASVIEDSTELGPAHALMPMQCGDKLGLFAGARLPAGETVEPPTELRAREGLVALAEGKSEIVATSTRPGCTPLAIPLP